MLRFVLLICCLVFASMAHAATNPMDNAPVLEDAGRIWAEQAADVFVPKHGALYLDGIYVWHGRADREYKAFHQWEVKLKAGDKGAKGVKFRVIPLDSEMNVQQLFRKKQTPWHNADDLEAGAESIISYKLNCSHITSYRMELRWEGGSQDLFAGTRFMLPIDAKALEKQPYLTVSDVDFKYKRSRKQAMVSFYLTNVGGGQADDVEHTIEFLDGKGKVVHKEVYAPEKGTVPAKYGKRQEVKYKKIPKFENVNIRTKQKQLLTYEIDGDQLVAKEDIGLSGVAQDGENIVGVITNGFTEAVFDLVVTITFEDGSGKVIKTLDVKVKNLEPGAETKFSEKVGKDFTFKAYGMSYQFGAAE